MGDKPKYKLGFLIRSKWAVCVGSWLVILLGVAVGVKYGRVLLKAQSVVK